MPETLIPEPWTLLWQVVGNVMSIAFFNYFGVSVTQSMSATHRMCDPPPSHTSLRNPALHFVCLPVKSGACETCNLVNPQRRLQ